MAVLDVMPYGGAAGSGQFLSSSCVTTQEEPLTRVRARKHAFGSRGELISGEVEAAAGERLSAVPGNPAVRPQEESAHRTAGPLA